jgi:ACS family hexuronate transporter-like MFS transporter
MSTTQAVSANALPAPGWRMWVPCLGMALCSWLAFVDRQVWSALSPTILADTGLTAGQFADASSLFFLAYMFANPVWGSTLDYVGLRVGMLLAVALWTAASISHAWMSTFLGFALARAVLGLGEGATFPGGLRTAVESLPAHLRARGIATSFSGGTIGAIVTPLLAGWVAAEYGWRAAFYMTGAFGVAWLLIWAAIARPPFLPAVGARPTAMRWPNLAERRVWALVFSYALPALAPGPVLTILPVYLNRGLGVGQNQINAVFWIPPLAWGIGYFLFGWAADKFAANNRRPVGFFLALTAASLALAGVTMTQSLTMTMFLVSWSCFIGGGFQMVALKVGAYAFPREQAAMMSGIASGAWALVNFLFLRAIGPWSGWMDTGRWDVIFWLIALTPAVGVLVWLVLSRNQER